MCQSVQVGIHPTTLSDSQFVASCTVKVLNFWNDKPCKVHIPYFPMRILIGVAYKTDTMQPNECQRPRPQCL
jgi:hypothetical protein